MLTAGSLRCRYEGLWSSPPEPGRFRADQIIIFAALASGKTEYLAPRITEHVDTNLWLVEKVLGARIEVSGNRVLIQGIGFKRDA